MTRKLFFLFAVVVLLSGCGSSKKIVDLNLNYLPADYTPAKTTDNQAQAQIAEAATAVGQSLQQLSAVQMTVNPPKELNKPFSPDTPGMGKLASVSWTGPAEQLLKQIAKAAHYQFHVIGKKPAVPAIVVLDMHNTPLANILRNVIYQIVMKADVAVYAKARTIELRYKGN